MSKASKITVVGGNIYDMYGDMSSVVSKIAKEFARLGNYVRELNGPQRMGVPDISSSDLTLWMPNIPNTFEKNYPKKQKGSCLICSKLMHGKVTRADAVSRIFRMNANAVIAIYPSKNSMEGGYWYEFEVIDALGNIWCDKTEDIPTLVMSVMRFHEWSSSQKRVSIDTPYIPSEEFLALNRQLATKVQNSMGGRFFGNSSTRCMKLFPSLKIEAPPTPSENIFLFSARDTDKEHLKADDFVSIECFGPDKYINLGQKKSSVDTPVQLGVYKLRYLINYMIHGHAFIKDAPTTKDYFPCGDMRELNGILEITSARVPIFTINLKQHGFLIGARSLPDLQKVIETSEIIPLDLFREQRKFLS